MNKQSSLFDDPRPVLNPAIWLDENTIRPEVSKYIHDVLYQIFPPTLVSRLIMIGSNTTYTYSETSDIDVSVVARKGEDYDKWHTIFKKYNRLPHLLPGTLHQVNFMFQEYIPFSEEDWSNSLGAYDLTTKQWEKRPTPFSQLVPPEKKFEKEIASAKILYAMFESEYKRAKEAYARGDKQAALSIISDLKRFADNLDDQRKLAYRYGTGTPSLQEHSVTYKIFEHSPLGQFFEDLIHED